MYTEDDFIPLSALQHLLFCERQCALIHIEQIWSENLFTAEGRIMHERVHEADRQSRGKVRIEYSMWLRSLRLGLIGKAYVVEFHRKTDPLKAGPAELKHKISEAQIPGSFVAPHAGAWDESNQLISIFVKSIGTAKKNEDKTS